MVSLRLGPCCSVVSWRDFHCLLSHFFASTLSYKVVPLHKLTIVLCELCSRSPSPARDYTWTPQQNASRHLNSEFLTFLNTSPPFASGLTTAHHHDRSLSCSTQRAHIHHASLSLNKDVGCSLIIFWLYASRSQLHSASSRRSQQTLLTDTVSDLRFSFTAGLLLHSSGSSFASITRKSLSRFLSLTELLKNHLFSSTGDITSHINSLSPSLGLWPSPLFTFARLLPCTPTSSSRIHHLLRSLRF